MRNPETGMMGEAVDGRSMMSTGLNRRREDSLDALSLSRITCC